jgi:hypothetical protein
MGHLTGWSNQQQAGERQPGDRSNAPEYSLISDSYVTVQPFPSQHRGYFSLQA